MDITYRRIVIVSSIPGQGSADSDLVETEREKKDWPVLEIKNKMRLDVNSGKSTISPRRLNEVLEAYSDQ